jgi:hypothetical protein
MKMTGFSTFACIASALLADFSSRKKASLSASKLLALIGTLVPDANKA